MNETEPKVERCSYSISGLKSLNEMRVNDSEMSMRWNNEQWWEQDSKCQDQDQDSEAQD